MVQFDVDASFGVVAGKRALEKHHQALLQKGPASELQTEGIQRVHDQSAPTLGQIPETVDRRGPKTIELGDGQFLQRDKNSLKLLLRRPEAKLYRITRNPRKRQATTQT